MRKFIAALALAVIAALPAAAPAAASVDPIAVSASAVVSEAPDPNTCVGYPEPRVGVEIQGWWQDRIGEAFPGRHIHVFTCWPTGVVTGTVGLDLKLQTHGQPAGTYVSRLRATDGGGGNVFPAMTSGFSPIVDGSMVQWIHKDVNTTGLSTGLHEIRLAAYVRQNGFDQLVSSDLPLFVRSMSGGATSRDYVEARGWYPGFLYTNARYRNRLSDFLAPVPDLWTPTFQCASPSGANGDRFVVAIDPKYHDLNMGWELLRYAGETTRKLSIDTTGLAPGTHKIVASCAADDNLSGHDGTSTGVLAINFTR